MAKKAAGKPDPATEKLIKQLLKQAAEARKEAEKLLKEATQFEKKAKSLKSGGADIELQELQRLVDKRAQMFDIMSKTIDKYNETANNVIRSMGR